MEELEDYLRRSLKPRSIDVPSAVDRAVLAAAARGISGGSQVMRPWRWVAPLVATAAAAAVAFFVTLRGADAPTPRAFDIVDAYQLSLRVADGSSQADAVWDLNQDGRVDDQDVRRIRQLAVALDGVAEI